MHFIIPVKPSMDTFKGTVPQNHSFLAVFACRSMSNDQDVKCTLMNVLDIFLYL